MTNSLISAHEGILSLSFSPQSPEISKPSTPSERDEAVSALWKWREVLLAGPEEQEPLQFRRVSVDCLLGLKQAFPVFSKKHIKRETNGIFEKDGWGVMFTNATSDKIEYEVVGSKLHVKICESKYLEYSEKGYFFNGFFEYEGKIYFLERMACHPLGETLFEISIVHGTAKIVKLKTLIEADQKAAAATTAASI